MPSVDICYAYSCHPFSTKPSTHLVPSFHSILCRFLSFLSFTNCLLKYPPCSPPTNCQLLSISISCYPSLIVGGYTRGQVLEVNSKSTGHSVSAILFPDYFHFCFRSILPHNHQHIFAEIFDSWAVIAHFFWF